MQSQSHDFKGNVERALKDVNLQAAMARTKGGLAAKRATAVAGFPGWQELRAHAKQIRDHTLGHLDYYLQRYETAVTKNGGQVHWAVDGEQACDLIVGICKQAGAKTVTKGKSMIGEEAGLNIALQAAGLRAVETDLGEYIIQLADEPPSHIIAPAVHKTKEQVSDLFYEHHKQYGQEERITDRAQLVGEARKVLRKEFLAADVGIIGANFLVAETGQNVLVTNEGNGDLTSCLPRVHIVITSIDKVIPTLDDLATITRLLGRSATGQEISNYTTLFSGPKRPGDLDGAEEFHVVLVDNGRSEMLGNEFREMLRCIRCGACQNHCPVYGAIGGHAYGWVYAGPMGSVLTPLMVGLEEAADLPNACTLNGRCAEVCPMSIPLPDLLREHRRREYERKLNSAVVRGALSAWAFLATRPTLYRLATGLPMKLMGWLGKKRGAFRSLPLAGGWTRDRDLPAPQGETFVARFNQQRRPR